MRELFRSTANRDFKWHELGSLESLVRKASFDARGKADFVGWRSEPPARRSTPRFLVVKVTVCCPIFARLPGLPKGKRSSCRRFAAAALRRARQRIRVSGRPNGRRRLRDELRSRPRRREFDMPRIREFNVRRFHAHSSMRIPCGLFTFRALKGQAAATRDAVDQSRAHITEADTPLAINTMRSERTSPVYCSGSPADEDADSSPLRAATKRGYEGSVMRIFRRPS
jgi:hypothetical protein